MTLKMIAGLLSPLAEDTMFFDGEGVEIINENTQAHYHELPDHKITLGGDVIEASKAVSYTHLTLPTTPYV